MDIMILAFYVP